MAIQAKRKLGIRELGKKIAPIVVWGEREKEEGREKLFGMGRQTKRPSFTC